MKVITKSTDIYKLLVRYVVMFPKNEIPPQRVRMYSDRLTNYSLTQITDAMEQIVRSSNFFPTLAEIITVIRSNYREPIYGSPEWEQQERKKAEDKARVIQMLEKSDREREAYLAKFTKKKGVTND